MGELHPLPAREVAPGAPEREGRVLPFRRLADAEGEAIEPVDASEEQPRTCLMCLNASIGPVTYCTKFKEEIIFESVAASDCEEYEFDDDGALEWGD